MHGGSIGVSKAASSAIGYWCQVDAVWTNESRDNVYFERDRLEAGREKIDPVRTDCKQQRLGPNGERARDTYVLAIDVDKSVGWSDGETDSAPVGFRWNVRCRVREFVDRVRVAVVRVRVQSEIHRRIVWERIIRKRIVRVRVRIAPPPGERIVMERSMREVAMVVAMMPMMTIVVIEVSTMVAVIEMTAMIVIEASAVIARIEMMTMIRVIAAASVALHRVVGIGML